MTMVYTADGLLYTAIPFELLAAMNKTDGKVDVRVWDFGGTSEEAAQKRAIFNSWFLAVTKQKFKEPDYPSRYEPDSRYRVLAEELEALVLENMEDDGAFDACPGPNQDYQDPNQSVFYWASWILHRLFNHKFIECGFDDEWHYLDREADELERSYTQAVQRREGDEAYRAYLDNRPPGVKQKATLTAKPATIRQVMDFIALMNRKHQDQDDVVEVEQIDTGDATQREAAYR
jgi:hypothetical protein